jgi:hypothetical protein
MLLLIAACCGCPAYYGKPMWDQYPATASLPAELAGLDLRDDAAGGVTSKKLEAKTRAAHPLVEHTFAGVYRESNGKQVTVFGTTGFRFSPDKDVESEANRLTKDYQLTDVQPVETHVRGEYERCGTGEADGTDVVVCTWADHGSLGTALFERRNLTDSIELLNTLRTNIVSRDGPNIG